MLGRIQKSVTKWSLIAWKTAPRSGHSSLVGVRLAGACVSCVPTSASRARGALRLPGLPGRPYLSAVEPARGPWASPAQVGCPHSGKSGAGRLCLSFTKKLSESWGDFLSSFFFNLPQLTVAPVAQPQSSPAHSFPGKCLHREGPSWEIHLTSEHRVWRMGRAKSGPSLCWRLLLPAWEASFRRVPVTPGASPAPVGTPVGMAPSRLVSSCDIPAYSLG